MVAVGGSAGGSHAAYCAATGTAGLDKLDAAVSLSGAYAFDDAKSLADTSRRNFAGDVKNYVNSSDLAKLHAASPATYVNPFISPLFIVETNNDPMPPPQFDAMIAAFKAHGVTNYQTKIIGEANGRDGFTRHAFEYWPTVKDDAIAFLKAHLGPAPTPQPVTTVTPTPVPWSTIYPKGVWASMGAGATVPPALAANKGIVGVIVTTDWD